MRLFLLPSALRRLAASAMLAALASFVLHGGAMAAHRHAPASTAHSHGPAAGHDHPRGHAHGSVAHDHGDGVLHVHAAPADADEAFENGGASRGLHAEGGAEAPCCGSACAVAIPAFAPGMASLPMTAAVLLPASQDGAGIDPSALKRPPRTPDIA